MPPLSTGASDASNLNQINNTMRDIKQKQITDIRKDGDGTRRVLFGKGADGFYGLKVSPEGVDVYTATDDQLIFNSNQNVFKILQSGSIDLTQGSVSSPGAGNFGQGSAALGTVTHNLGYKPAAIAFIEFSTGARAPLPYTTYALSTASNVAWSTVYMVITDTVFQVKYNMMVYGGAWNTFTPPVSVKYYLLQETAE